MSLASNYKRNIPLLAVCQALFMSGTTLIVSTTTLVGYALSTDKTFASLPFASQLIATMLTSIPAAMLMARIGRKPAFLMATGIAMCGAFTCTLAIIQQQFLLFVAGSILLGVFTGFANYYRFTAADTVDKAHKSRAIAYVLAGGVFAAVIGPNLANLTRDSLGHAAFAGSFASIIVLYILSFVLLTFLKLPPAHSGPRHKSHTSGRPLSHIARQPRFIVAVICGMLGYAIMSLIMTATPLAMHHYAYPFSDTSFVIQWHVLGMFAPSFITGHLIRRFGLLRVMLTGAVFELACVLINLMGSSVVHFWIALVFLGVSWNFLFIGATTLLTETYAAEERFKTQALNDFLVFSMVSTASLTAGILEQHYGWQFVNYGAIPAIGIIFIGLIWLYRQDRVQQLEPDVEVLQEAINRIEP